MATVVEQWPNEDQITDLRTRAHTSQATPAGAPRQVEHNGLKLIISSMTQGNYIRVPVGNNRFEETQAGVSGSFLPRAPHAAQIDTVGEKRHAVTLCLLPGAIQVSIGFRSAPAVVQMRHGEVDSELWCQADQDI
jgi:hypothetical protein